MYIKYLDYLSPRITFYYKGFLSHSSIASGIISIISIIFLIILVVYFSLDIIQRKDPNTSYFKSFTGDAGEYQINTSSLFHFINIVKNERGNIIYEEFDFTYFNIIGVQAYTDNYLSNLDRNGIYSFDHWIYGYCNKEVNTEGLDDLITYKSFEKSACIKMFYNKSDDQYYNIGVSNFSWPRIAHGTFNESNVLYGLNIQRCNNITIKKILGNEYVCKSKEEIDSFFKFRGSIIIYFYFVNNYINVLSYEKPNNKFFYRIENPFTYDKYSTNDININPALIQTHNGLIFDNIKEEVSYMFDRNDVYTGSNEGKDIFIGYCFFLKNIEEYYERAYKRVQEVISSIGGINQAITIISVYINYLYNNYIILSDTEALLDSAIRVEKTIHKRKSVYYRNLKHKMKDMKKFNNYEKNTKSERTISKIISDNRNENNISKSKNNFTTIQEKSDANNIHIKHNIKFSKGLDRIETINTLSLNYNNNQSTFLNYLYYMITFKKKKNFFGIYENFRIKIMSEEHLIRNHLNIYNILKVLEKKRHIRRYSYKIEDLVQML